MSRSTIRSPRSPGTRMSVSDRLRYAASIREALAENPAVTVEEVQAKVPGVPHKMVTEVRRLWRMRSVCPEVAQP